MTASQTASALAPDRGPAIRILNYTTFAMVPMVAGASLVAGTPLWLAPLMALVFALIGIAAPSAQPSRAPLIAAFSVVGQPIALTAALSGHAWQIDSHMLFFASLAGLVALGSVPAILLATAVIAVHHLGLTLLLPSLVYPSADLGGNLQRTIFHAVIVLAEAAAIVFAIRRQNALLAQNADQLAAVADATTAAEAARDSALAASREAGAQSREAEDMRKRAEDALAQTERERAAAAEADSRARESEEERRREEQRQRDAQRRVVQQLGQGLRALAEGDLTHRLTDAFPEQYEAVRTDFNTAIDALAAAVDQVNDQADRMLADIDGLRGTAADLSERASRQSGSLERSAGALKTATDVVTSTAEGAARVSDSARGARRSVEDSGEVVRRSSDAMAAINDSAQEIHKIIDVIDQIAFQTNLLALNAGVEAARAGEAGRGFAVVATEVRELAQRSSVAARDISNLISKSQAHVDEGVKNVGDTVSALETVAASVVEIAARIDEIAGAATDQAKGLTEINTSVAGLDADTRRSAALSADTASAAETLAESAAEMKRLTSRFRRAAPPASRPRAVA